MRNISANNRYHAASMKLAAYLDGKYVEMHIQSDNGEQLIIVCDKDSIFDIQRNIEKIGQDCPEILTWRKLGSPWKLHEVAKARAITNKTIPFARELL